MTVRFNCWVKAESLDEAWKQLEKVCGDVYNRESWIEEKFSGTVLEDPEEDKKNMEEGV